MIHLKKMEKAIASPFDFVPEERAVGYVCSYLPEEIVLAAGYTPVRLFGVGGDGTKAPSHLQTYACSLVRGILEEALSGRTEKMAAVVFPDACDTIRRLSDIWRMNIRGPHHLDLVLPVKLNTKSAEIYTAHILKRFLDEISSLAGVPISQNSLKEAIALMNEIREILAHIDHLRARGVLGLSTRDYYTVLRAAMVMDRYEYVQMLREMHDHLRETEREKPKKPRLFIAGGMCKLPEIFDAIEEAGGSVVGDDLCSGTRYFSTPCRTDIDPLKALVKRIHARPVCPAKHQGLMNRFDHISRRVEETHAQGVIILVYKFCDPHAFDFPDLKKNLAQRGVPVLLLEIEDPLPSQGQIRTRCEAFIEMIDKG
ncbi:MAG TPA: 2-hydroxyacyl-CoA dehydratase family protein [Syntrophales bacterium]|nr:2-hydroxyacyl-CoA dehydratase family protein [Syntrophales bacterium]HOL58585.1 2-hydroxyacyl-CoA dehydratase family protein [Syntrophales bacterium]HPO34807.1 2-hydroxyacyl-CoA dehydratase family protein [Syntrophales bacterium]